MRNIMDLAKIVFSFLSRNADAKRNLEGYLKGYFRPELLEKVKLNNILSSVAKKISSKEDRELFLEDIVDKFLDAKAGEDVRALLTSKAKKNLNVDDDTAFKLISDGKLNTEEKALFKKGLNDFVPLFSGYLLTFLTNQYKVWVAEHAKTPRIIEDAIAPDEDPDIDTGISPDSGKGTPEPLIEEGKKNGWEEGLIKDVIDLINRKSPDKKKSIYKKILKNMFLSKKPDTLSQLSKKMDLSVGALFKYKGELQRMLAEFLTAQGLGGDYLEEGGATRKKIDYPRYKDYLSDKKNAKDFKEFIKDKSDEKMGDIALKVINVLSEGKTTAEAVSESGASLSNVKVIKNRYFDKWYKEWYEEKIEGIKKNAFSFYVKAQMGLQGKRVVIPVEKKDKKEKGEDTGDTVPAHEKMVSTAIEKNGIKATIYFTANYDNTNVLSGRKVPEKDPVDFAYKNYEASLFVEKSFGKKSRSLDYRLIIGLNDDGSFKNNESSTLELDGEKVLSDDRLKKTLNDYVKAHMMSEGVIPYGKAFSEKTKNVLFRTRYTNIKTNKNYKGVMQFMNQYRGLFIEDDLSAKRKDFVDSLRKTLSVPVSDREKIKKMIYEFKDEIEDLKNGRPRDSKRIKELEDQVKKLRVLIKGDDEAETRKRLDQIVEEEMLLLKNTKDTKKEASIIYAAVFPSSTSGPVKDLISLVEKYGISKNVTGWLLPVELLSLSKTIKARTKISLDEFFKKIKKEKGKKEDKEQKINEAKKIAREDIKKAISAFEALPDDLKKRRDTFAHKFKKDYKTFASKRDMGWVDSTPEIDRILGKIKRELNVEITELGKMQTQKKQENVSMLTRANYDSLLAFIEQAQVGLDVIAQRLGKASMLEEDINPEASQRITSDISKSKSAIEKLEKEIKNYSKEEANSAPVRALESQLPKLKSDIRKMEKTLHAGKEIPALLIAEVLKDKISYFNRLFSFAHRVLWSDYYDYAKAAGEKDTEKDTKKDTEKDDASLKRLRDDIVKIIDQVAEYPFHAKDSIKSSLSKASTLLKKFISQFDSSYSLHHYEIVKPKMQSHANIKNRLSFPYLRAADQSEFEKARSKMIFPADGLIAAKNIISEIKKDVNPKISVQSDKAQKELNSLIKNITTAYGQSFDSDKIKAIAEKEKIPYNKASLRLKKIQDSLASSALNEFILNWQEVKEPFGHQKNERSDLGNKPSENYDYMGAYVERRLPKLFSLSPKEEIPQEAERGVPTPKVIRERIEEEFTQNNPIEEKYDFFVDSSGTSGGGGGKSKGRAKIIKPPLPNAALESMKTKIVQKFKSLDPQRIVLYVLAEYTEHVNKKIKGLKEDEYIDADGVIDYYVSLLKNLQNLITNLKIAPHNASKFTDAPDIAISTSKEAKDIFEKILGVYKTINTFIAPDQIGVPPANISNQRKQKKYLPYDLLEWYQSLKGQEEKQKKTADHLHTAQHKIVAQRFMASVADVDPEERNILL